MGNAVVYHRIDDRIAENHLTVIGCRRVIVEHSLNVRIEQTLDFGQCINELQGSLFSTSIDDLPIVQVCAVIAELQSVGYLLDEQALQFYHVVADVVRTYRFVRLSLVEVVGKHDALHQSDNALHMFYGGQGSLDCRHHPNLLFGQP